MITLKAKNLLPLLLSLFIFLSCVLFQTTAQAADNHFTKTVKVQLNDGPREVKTVWIDMKDPRIRVEAVLAKGRIGAVDSFENIYNSAGDNETEVIAAINGTFFNSYTDMQPAGNIQTQGRNAFISNNGTSIGFTVDNQVRMESLYTTISGPINGNWDYPYNWSVWGMNQVYSSADANVLFTPDFGDSVDAGSKTAIVVRNNRVVAVQKGLSPIYSDGFTLVFGAEAYSSLFKTGDRVDYKVNYHLIDFSDGIKKGNPIDWSNVRTTIGAGPTLLKNGEISLNAAKEGFTDVKFAGRAQRSFIGESRDGFLVIGTVNNVTLSELASILKDMRLKNAMNLDGGASSALMFENKIITSPSRKLSNAIVITKKKERPVRIQLNGREMFFDTDPYFYNQRTMVPLRGIMEAVGAVVGWDSATGTIWALKGDIRVEMRNDSNIIRVNGVDREMDVPIQVRYNRTHVPVRFITEIFGAEVDFVREKNMVTILMENSNPTDVYDRAVAELNSGNTAGAERLFLEVLNLDSSHAGAMLKLAKLYASTDKAKAAAYYEKYLEIQPKDYDVWNSLGWIYSDLGNVRKAIDVFRHLSEQNPDTAAYWIALGELHEHYQIQDYQAAKEYYNRALNCSNISESQKSKVYEKLKKF